MLRCSSLVVSRVVSDVILLVSLVIFVWYWGMEAGGLSMGVMEGNEGVREVDGERFRLLDDGLGSSSSEMSSVSRRSDDPWRGDVGRLGTVNGSMGGEAGAAAALAVAAVPVAAVAVVVTVAGAVAVALAGTPVMGVTGFRGGSEVCSVDI